jgi:hypothetical protein
MTYLAGSIIGAKSATLGPSLFCTFLSHPTAFGLTSLISTFPLETTAKRLFHVDDATGGSASRQQRIRMDVPVDG